MRKAIGAMIVLVVLSLAAPAQAGPIYVGAYVTISQTGLGGFNGGGEYLVSPTNGSVFDPFVTFCIQLTESISFGPTFYVYGLTDFAEPEHDLLDNRTAWIYRNYNPLGYGLGFTATQLANAVQNAIWFLEEGEPLTADGQAVYNLAVAANPSNLGGVKAINLRATDANGVTKQDLLAPIPEPGSMLLLGSGLVGLAKMAKRRRNR